MLKVLTHSIDVANLLTPLDGNQVYIQFKDAKTASKLIDDKIRTIDKNTICLFAPNTKNLIVLMIQTEDLLVRTEAFVREPVRLAKKTVVFGTRLCERFPWTTSDRNSADFCFISSDVSLLLTSIE
ncbi:hypothetical protein M3Y94_01127600 [Aphelenchoides besseyi]|nr:hypothetical protein M3Y94_01127600 [Aphelenchoides besseyi]